MLMAGTFQPRLRLWWKDPPKESDIKDHLNARRKGKGCFSYKDGCWSVAYGNTFVFGLPLNVAQDLVPPELTVAEVDGSGICEVGFMAFDGNNLASDPHGFMELSFAVGVVPTEDHKTWMGWHTLRIASTSKTFLDDAESRVQLPVYRPQSIQFDRSAGIHDVTVVADGDPILTLQTDLQPILNSCADMAVFAEISSENQKGVWRAGFGVMGRLSQSKGEPNQKVCKFHDHAFFRGIKTRGATLDARVIPPMAREIYLAKPGEPLYQHFTPPVLALP